jgi:competence protein ComEC
LPALALLAGATLWGTAAPAATFLVAAGLVACALGTGARAAAFVSAAFLLGCGLASLSVRASEARVAWLPEGGDLEASFVGSVLDAPECDASGSRTMRVRGRREGAEGAAAPTMTLRLRIDGSLEAMGSIDALRRGDCIRVFCRIRTPPRAGAPGEDLRASLRVQEIDAVGSVKSPRLLERISVGGPSPLRLLDEARVALRDRLDHVAPPESRERGVLGAMLLGERGRVGSADLLLLRDSGLIHILAISGLNVTLVMAALFFLLRRAPLGVSVRFFVAVAVLVSFCIVVGSAPSVLRAGAAVGLHLLGRRIGRAGDPCNTLAIVALALTALQPALGRDPGFDLSVLATAGILTLSNPIARALPLPRPAGIALGASLAAYVATAPVAAWHFGRLAPIAVFSNLLAAPLAAAVLLTGLLAILLSPVPWLGAGVAWLAVASVRALLEVARLACAVPGGALRIARPSAMLVLAALVLLTLGAGWRPVRRWPVHRDARRVLLLSISLALVRLHAGPMPGARATHAEAAVLDVGQGQAVAVRAAAGRCLLVDAGGTSGGRFDAGDRIVAPFLASWGCRRLDAVILTHDHDDHAGGIRAVLRDFEVGELWVGAGSAREPVTASLVADAVRNGTAVVLASRGFAARRAGLDVAVLHPSRDDARLSINDRCLVVRLSDHGAKLLIPGDLEAAGERRLLSAVADASASALVVGHHGAANSTGEPFLRAVGPSVAIVSVGRGNRFGHPSAAVLERLRRAGARTYRTDRDGTVLVGAIDGRFVASSASEGLGDEREDEDRKEEDRD